MNPTAQNHNRELIFHEVESNEEFIKVVKEEIESNDKNPAHFCMGDNCNKFLGHRGFCSTKCHDSHYNGLIA